MSRLGLLSRVSRITNWVFNATRTYTFMCVQTWLCSFSIYSISQQTSTRSLASSLSSAQCDELFYRLQLSMPSSSLSNIYELSDFQLSDAKSSSAQISRVRSRSNGSSKAESCSNEVDLWVLSWMMILRLGPLSWTMRKLWRFSSVARARKRFVPCK